MAQRESDDNRITTYLGSIEQNDNQRQRKVAIPWQQNIDKAYNESDTKEQLALIGHLI